MKHERHAGSEEALLFGKSPSLAGCIMFRHERYKQIDKGYDVHYDVEHNSDYELAIGAQLIAFTPNEGMDMTDRYEMLVKLTGWEPYFCETVLEKDYKDRLRIAGALLAGEYDRITYLENKRKNDSNTASNTADSASDRTRDSLGER